MLIETSDLRSPSTFKWESIICLIEFTSDFGQIVTLGIPVDLGHLKDFLGRRSSDTVNICQSDLDTLVLR